MNSEQRTVLACIDGSEFHDAVIDYAAWISNTVHSPLTLLHNIEHRHTPRADLSGSIGLGAREHLLEELTQLEARSNKILMEQGKLMLDHASARAKSLGISDAALLQRHGSFADTLIAMEEAIRVLVLGVRGEDHINEHQRIGSQLETVIRNMHRPVLVVNAPFQRPPQRIMLAYDGSESAKKALDMVTTSPLYEGVTCHVVHVSKSGHGEDNLLSEAGERLRSAGISTEISNLHGDVDSALVSYNLMHKIEMTVMGAFGHSRLRELIFGSTTIKMLCHSRVPLLLLR